MAPSMKKALLLTAATLFSTSNAYQVTFYLGEMCTNEDEGTYNSGSDVSNAQCFQVPINAQAATVVKQKSDAANTNVEFYSSTNCDSSTGVGSTDSGCVTFENAQSWMLQDNLSDPGKRRVKRQAPWWTSRQETIRSELGISPEDATGSLSPIWDPYAQVEAGFGHGNVTERFGRTWKWQQVALGVTIGIPVEDWDDEVHTLSNQFIPYGDVDYEAELLRKRGLGLAEREIEKRWNYGQCHAVLDCGRKFATAATANIGNGWTQAVRGAYKLKTYGKTFYDWAHAHPFTTSIAIGGSTTLAGYGLGYSHGGATAQDNDQLGQCSGDSTQVNSFIQALTQAAGASGYSAAQTDITLDDGHILAVSAEVYPKGQPPEATQCDAGGSH